ncbi:hypothetical protein [Spirosoma luteum]|uniref:hypothetical protein n=1 Tax=Spirosoma luteum TaxID=431553 RepID=UPI00039F9EBF|nr:hypothetical protein [Spirosoma luteum]
MNNAILVILLPGGLTTNAIRTIYLNKKPDVYRLPEHLDAHRAQHHLLRDGWFYLVFSVLFLRHGDSRMGEYRFSGWPLHLAYIIAYGVDEA